MEWPDTKATELTEAIMARNAVHLLSDEKNYPHHYNRAFEEIHKILTQHLGA